MKKKRIVSGVLAGLLSVSAVGAFAGCDSVINDKTIWIAFSETGYGRAFIEKWRDDFLEAYPNDGWNFYLEGEPGMTEEIYNRLYTDTDVPDMFFSLETNWQQWAARGLLMPLDEVYASPVDETGLTLEEFLNPGIKDYGKLTDGHYYAIPWSDGANGLIYNLNMFTENGWEVPETVDDLIALCAEIKALPCNADADPNNDIAPFAWAGPQAAYWDFLVETWWAQYEGEEKFTEFFKFEDPFVYVQQGRVEALRAFSDLVVNTNTYAAPKNSISGALGTTYTLSQQAFLQGKAAMIPNGPWMENEMKTFIKDGFEMRLMPTPYIEGAKTDSSGDYIQINASSAGDFFCIPKNAYNTEGAIKFMKFINTRSASETYTKVTGGMRPFQYKASEIKGLQVSGFIQSCLDVYENSVTVYHYSTSPMQWLNKLGKWPEVGSPYVAMIGGEYLTETSDDQAVQICQICCDYAYNEWWDIYNSVF